MTQLVLHSILAAALTLSVQRPAAVPLRAGSVIDCSTTLSAVTGALDDLDDDVRGWVDDAMMLDDGAPHESRVRRVPVGGGTRQFRVEYDNVTGFAEVRFDIQRK